MIRLVADASIYGFTHMFTSLAIDSTALLVCKVEITRCHVKAALIAISAVSSDLISHTIIISGSCLNIPFNHSSKV